MLNLESEHPGLFPPMRSARMLSASRIVIDEKVVIDIRSRPGAVLARLGLKATFLCNCGRKFGDDWWHMERHRRKCKRRKSAAFLAGKV